MPILKLAGGEGGGAKSNESLESVVAFTYFLGKEPNHTTAREPGPLERNQYYLVIGITVFYIILQNLYTVHTAVFPLVYCTIM
jgi:hypothetical protein